MVQVEVEEGILEGELNDNAYGGTFYSFKGIPYAEPPLGDLRFKPPKPVKPWDGVRPAKEFGSVSYQRCAFQKIPIGGEDCLYLNVYSPNVKPDTPLPVMFWIHGGAFVWGSGNDNIYGPEFIVRNDVILVTCNYRLGALGFLSLDTKDISGNAGMKDQVLALKWVNKNISKFGGDPDNITLFGESAGGCSVSFHLVSPMSKGLFKRAIVQSGTLAAFWATTFFPRENALALARQLGCHSENDEELKEFFLNQPVDVFKDLHLPVTLSRKPYELSFAIVSEKDFGNERFFTGDPFDCLRNDIHDGVEVIVGYTEDEGLLTLKFDPTRNGLAKLYALANSYVEFFVPKRISVECPFNKQIELGREIKQYYFQNKPVSEDNLESMFKYLHMDAFIYDILALTKFIAKKNKVYLYKFTCKSERNRMAELLGLAEITNNKPVVCHADDLLYLFPARSIFPQIDTDSETFRYIENVTKLWTNFAKYGHPTPDETLGVKWVPYNHEDKEYLDIGHSLSIKSEPEKEEVEFWESIYRKYLPRCIA